MFGSYLFVICNVISTQLLRIFSDIKIEEVSKGYRRSIEEVSKRYLTSLSYSEKTFVLYWKTFPRYFKKCLWFLSDESMRKKKIICTVIIGLFISYLVR